MKALRTIIFLVSILPLCLEAKDTHPLPCTENISSKSYNKNLSFSYQGSMDDVDISRASRNQLKGLVAKLFVVGIPTDYLNSANSSKFRAIINCLGVGGVILNTYNFPKKELEKYENRDHAFEKAGRLIKDIHSSTRKNSQSPLIYVDYESSRFSSIGYPLYPPADALTIASTGDTKYAYISGKFSAYQLKQLGVNVILGPVLDSNKGSKQGQLNTTINNRTFSDSTDIISIFSKRYIEGVRSYNIGTFIKHFPTYSSVSENPHSKIVSFTGSVDQIENDSKPFLKTGSISNGIMTSHLQIDVEKNPIPFTISPLVKKYIRNNETFKNKLIITDDMADMAALTKYLDAINKNYSYAALEAFKSGHDLLLFSHIEKNSKNGFKIKNLEESIITITNYIEKNPEAKKQLKESLNRINKLRESTSSTFTNVAPSFDHEARKLFEDSSFFNSIDFLESLYKNATISIKGDKFPSEKETHLSSKILIIAPKNGMEIYKKYLTGPKFTFKTMTVNGIISSGKELIKNLTDNSIVYYSVENIDDANTIDYVQLKRADLLNRLVILLHENPLLLKTGVVSKASYIFGNFSKSDQSYISYAKLILGETSPSSIKNLTVNINNGSYHSIGESINKIKDREYPSGFSEIFLTKKERDMSEELSEVKKTNIELSNKLKDLKSESKKVDINAQNRVELLLTEKTIFYFYILLYITTFIMLTKYFHKNYSDDETYLSFLKNNTQYFYNPSSTHTFLFFFKWGSIVIFAYYLFPNNDLAKSITELFFDKIGASSITEKFNDIYPGNFYLTSEKP